MSGQKSGEGSQASAEKRELQVEAQSAVRLCRKGAYGEALAKLERVLAVYREDIGRLPARLLSYYGVCLAEERGKVADGLDFCKTSISKDPFHADHYANIARVYHLRHARKRAVDALRRASTFDLDNTLAKNLWSEMGRRRKPVLKFLPRDHRVNQLLGRLVRRRTD